MKEITMDDYQFLDSFKKKRIQLTLRSAAYAGTVQRINLNNKSVLLGDVVDVKSGRKFAGMKLFFGHEILNVELPHAPKPEQGNKEDHSRSTEGQLPVEFQPYRKNIKLDDDEDDGEYVDFVVIDEFFEKFGPAVMDIRKQQVIGIGADGVGVSQHERLCWLQIASKTRVYLFDILLLGARAFKNGLSMILESGHILKVTHDCRGIAGCLWTQYGVNLCNVFDTQVADVMSFHAETGGFLPDRVSTVQEVLALHLKMSPACLASLKVKSQLTKEDSEVWYVRPCPVSLLKVMALSVIHLQPLRMVLLDALMADYTGRVDCCLSVSREEPVNTQSIGTSSGLELPAQLRELESLHRQRRQWASARYPVTQGGLLIRSRPRPAPPPPAVELGEPPRRTSGSWGADLSMEAERSAPGEAGQGPGEAGQWGPQASGEGPGEAGQWGPQASGEGPGEAGQWGPQASGEGPGEAGQWGPQASGEGPGEAGQWGPQASGEGPGEAGQWGPQASGEGPGEAGQWGPQASGEGPGEAGQWGPQASGEGPGEAGQWGPQASGEGPGEAGQWGLQASGEGPGEAGQWGLQASGEGPGEAGQWGLQASGEGPGEAGQWGPQASGEGPGEAGQGPGEAGQWGPQASGEGPGEAGQWGPQASGEGPGEAGQGPGEAGQWGPQASGEGPGEAGQCSLQASGEGPGEAGQCSLQASGEGPGELSPSRPSPGLSSRARGRPSGSPEVTQIPGKAPSGEAPVPTAGRGRPLEIAGPGAEEGTAGRGRLPQREGAPRAATFPPAGRGLCLQIPPPVSRELPGAARLTAPRAPAPLSQQGPVSSAGRAGGAPTVGAGLSGNASPPGTMPENIVSFGRGLFFQKAPQSPSSQFILSLSSFKKAGQ